jgi:hypothetical protein
MFYPDFVRDAASQWRCQRCIDAPVQMTSWRAAEHEKTAKHERAVKRYIDGLNAANRSESAPSGIHRSTSGGTQYATNPFMDAFHDAIMAQPPRPGVSSRRSPPDSPPVPDIMDIDNDLPACVPTFARGENRRIRAAVDSALKAYLDSSTIDGSDTDESGGDIDERPTPVYSQGFSFLFSLYLLGLLMLFKTTSVHVGIGVMQRLGLGPGVLGLTALLVYL